MASQTSGSVRFAKPTRIPFSTSRSLDPGNRRNTRDPRGSRSPAGVAASIDRATFSTFLAAVDPFNHPDAQRRSRLLTNLEELERALDYPWDKWAAFLHPAQRRLVERDYNGPARISGSAGTGKAIVALHRAVALARRHPQSRVLLTTFSKALANGTCCRPLQPSRCSAAVPLADESRGTGTCARLPVGQMGGLPPPGSAAARRARLQRTGPHKRQCWHRQGYRRATPSGRLGSTTPAIACSADDLLKGPGEWDKSAIIAASQRSIVSAPSRSSE